MTSVPSQAVVPASVRPHFSSTRREPLLAVIVCANTRSTRRSVMKGDDLIPDLLARGRPAASEVAHYFGIAVQLEQVVNVIRSELAQGKSWRFQNDSHPAKYHAESGCLGPK
jgi:hypothetical protein